MRTVRLPTIHVVVITRMELGVDGYAHPPAPSGVPILHPLVYPLPTLWHTQPHLTLWNACLMQSCIPAVILWYNCPSRISAPLVYLPPLWYTHPTLGCTTSTPPGILALWTYPPQEGTLDQAYKPPKRDLGPSILTPTPCEQTHASESITFPRHHWRAVKMLNSSITTNNIYSSYRFTKNALTFRKIQLFPHIRQVSIYGIHD